MAPIYAIGDIHGHHDKLTQALAWVEADGGPEAEVICLGDLVDRGPDSRGVIETLWAGQAQGRNWSILRGNHDQLFLDYLNDGRLTHPRTRPGLTWTDDIIGGAQTLASYGVEIAGRDADALWAAAQAAVPEAHRHFLAGLPRYHQTDGFLFVHAGIAPGVPLDAQDPEDVLWIRAPFLDHTGPHPWMVVHGHTARPRPERHANRVNLDSGAGFGRALTVGVFDAGDVFTLSADGRSPLELTT